MKQLHTEKACVLERLRRECNDPVCILGVGNRDRGDDGAGSWVARELRGRTRATVIDAGAVPENHLEQVVRSRPRSIVFIDAVDFGAAAGELDVLDERSIAHAGLSTHGLSLRTAMGYLEARTRVRPVLLAIQPAQVSMQANLSPEVAGAVAWVRETLVSLLDHSERGTSIAQPGGTSQ